MPHYGVTHLSESWVRGWLWCEASLHHTLRCRAMAARSWIGGKKVAIWRWTSRPETTMNGTIYPGQNVGRCCFTACRLHAAGSSLVDT